MRQDYGTYLALLMCFLLCATCWLMAVFFAPTDFQQGEVYKIIFVHVPSAAIALGLASLGMLFWSIRTLLQPDIIMESKLRAWVEVGLLFTILTLVTGSIWGKPTWGTWWTWDARLTTTLLLAILQAAYLIIEKNLSPNKQKYRTLAVIALIAVVDSPIIYTSVKWARTLHQPASLIEKRGQTMDPTMLRILLICLVAQCLLAICLWAFRKKNLELKAELEKSQF